MKAVFLLQEAFYNKTIRQQADILSSLRVYNPDEMQWQSFEEALGYHPMAWLFWESQYGPPTPATQMPMSSYLGGHSKFNPRDLEAYPTGWEKAKRWLKRYGWIIALSAGIVTAAGIAAKRRGWMGKEKSHEFFNTLTKTGELTRSQLEYLKNHPEEARVLQSILLQYAAEVGDRTYIQDVVSQAGWFHDMARAIQSLMSKAGGTTTAPPAPPAGTSP